MKMNTDKMLNEKFCINNKYPIWYYKELRKVTLDEVIYTLLSDSFVVDIDGFKTEITFGKNRKNEIETNMKFGDINYKWFSSSEFIDLAFRKGIWYRITNKDTTEEYKNKYRKKLEIFKKEKTRKEYVDILSRVVINNKDIDKDTKDRLIKEIEEYTFEESENMFKLLLSKCKNN